LLAISGSWSQNEGMRVRPSLIAAFCLSGGVLAVAACTTDYQLGKGDPNYGGPNALAGQRPPGATVDVQAEGGTDPASVGSKPKCVASGGALADAGTCTVSFAKEVLAIYGTAGCGDVNCHGGATPRNLPRIDPGEPTAMWQEFQAFTLSNGKPYINPCSIDPAQSTISCNLAAGPPTLCGTHMPQGGQIQPTDIAKIETWLKCGAPNN
jgi:hypothetical protein